MAGLRWPEHCRGRLTPLLEIVRATLTQHLESAGPAPRWPAVPAAEAGEQAAIDIVVRAFALDPFEARALLLAIGVELDQRIAELCGRAQGDPRRRQATIGLALSALPGAHVDAFSPNGALRRWSLIELSAGEGFGDRGIRVDERLLHYVIGNSHLDLRLEGLIRRCAEGGALTESQQGRARLAVSLLERASERGQRPILQLMGAGRFERVAVARATARALDLDLHSLRAADIPTDGRRQAELVRIWAKEAVLGRSGLLIDAEAGQSPTERSALQHFLDLVGGLVLLSGGDPPELGGRGLLRLDVALPTAAEQRTLWTAALPTGLPDEEVEGLVAQFSLGPAAIADVAAQVRAEAPPAHALADRVWEAVRQRSRPALGALAERIEPRATWEGLVLPPAQKDVLRDIIAHVRQRQRVYEAWGFAGQSGRGLGISALFSGPSGTGKTMAAEVVARELRLDLVHVDLSSVVSKYIGETEKNLSRIFEAAEQGGAILLFDEADALFGQRSEVKDSHDRYANIEVSYLLQRMEAYRGLAVLTTNLEGNLDAAFMRRIRFILRFPYPEPEQRAEIWRRAFPAETPTRGLDNERLGRLDIPGGNIRNVALHAAFLAAEERSPVTMRHIAESARAELRKIGRTAPERELRSWA
jgi:hypothetical protein